MTVDMEVPPASTSDILSSPSPPSVASVASIAATCVPPLLIPIQAATFDQVKDLLDSFSRSLKARFTSIDNRISQGLASNAVDRNVSQDVLTLNSFSAPSAVVGHSKPISVPYSDGLGYNLVGPTVADAPQGGLSLLRLSFDDLLVRIRDIEALHVYIPDFFLSSVCGVVVHVSDYSFALSGESLRDSIVCVCVIHSCLPLDLLGIVTV